MSNVTVGQPPRQVPPGARSHAELGAPARNPEWLLGSLAPDRESCAGPGHRVIPAKQRRAFCLAAWPLDRKSTRLNSSHGYISYAVFCLKKNRKATTEFSMTKITNSCPRDG